MQTIYLRCDSGGSNKSYLIVGLHNGRYWYGAWGVYGKRALGTRQFKDRRHAENLMNQKLKKGYIEIDYATLFRTDHNLLFDMLCKHTPSSPHALRLMVDPSRRFAVCQQQVEASIEGLAGKLPPSQPTKQKQKKSSKDVGGVDDALCYNVLQSGFGVVTKELGRKIIKYIGSLLRDYCTVNPEDPVTMQAAKRIAKAKNRFDAIMEERDNFKVLLDKQFREDIPLIIYRARKGNSPVEKYLSKLNKEIMKEANLGSKDQAFLRDVFYNETFTLKQLHYLRALIRKIEDKKAAYVQTKFEKSPFQV